MKARVIKSCLAYLYGSGAINEIGTFCNDELSLTGKAILISDPTVWTIAGKQISENLMHAGFEKVESVFVKGAWKSEVDMIREKIRALGATVVFGIGGGVNMDVAKAAASEENINIITVPTIFATEAQTMALAVFRDGYRPNIRPILGCVVDTDIIKQAPWRFQAAGYSDFMGKTSGIADWELACSRKKEFTQNFSGIFGYELAKLQLRLLHKYAVAVKNKEEKAFDLFLQVFMIDGEINQLCKPGWNWGTEHAVARGLEDCVDVLHGEAVGISTILMTCWQGGDWKNVKKTLETVGAKVTAKQLGVSDDKIINALTDATSWVKQRPNYYTILHEKPLTDKTAQFLAEMTEVI
ncbi:MAG: iron-containing alcohol dehydrogenase [Candidatus Bathyarchaeota archaeon]|nr:MAG: iron-containing alcohol dehydrogenase [Candidatus Bathyarchaeota archaeon]